MDADGTLNGYDCELTRTISEAVSVPVIASGGAGELSHVADAFLRGGADAALVASMVHSGDFTCGEIKQYMIANNIPARRGFVRKES